MRCPRCQHEFPLHVKHSRTSKTAGEDVTFAMTGWRWTVYNWLLHHPDGATDEQMQVNLALNPNTQRPRRVELVAMGRVVDSGEIRLTRSGTKAVVWKATIPREQGRRFGALRRREAAYERRHHPDRNA